MPITIFEGFEKFRNNLEITDLQEKTVSLRQQNIRSVLERELTVLDSFLGGSYRRNTLIAPLANADIDIFMILDSQYYKLDGQAVLLNRVKQILRRTYSTTSDIFRDGQAVTIKFNDFRADIIPGFHRNNGGYLIPDSNLNRWIATDPKKHVGIWSDANKKHHNVLVPLLKMLKAWNKCRTPMLRSFHLETMVLDILNNVKIGNFPSALWYVFDKARTTIQQPVIDPAGYSGDISTYLDIPPGILLKLFLDPENKRKFIWKELEVAYTKASQAEELTSKGDVRSAYEKWRRIFGNYFPAYG